MSRLMNFEVLVMQGGRWSIHARYPSEKKDVAIEEGRRLDKSAGIAAVKVIKEVYDPEAGLSKEYIVFKSSGMKMAAAGAGRAAADAGAPGAADAQPTAQAHRSGTVEGNAAASPRRRAGGKTKKKKKSTLTSAVVKIMLVALFSIGLAALTLVMANVWLEGTVFGINMSGAAKHNILFGIFVGTFLLSALVLSITFLGKETLSSSKRSPVPSSGRAVPATSAASGSAAATTSGPTPANEEFRMAAAARHESDSAGDDVAAGPADGEPAPAADQAADQATPGRADEEEDAKARGVVLNAETAGTGAAPLSARAQRQKAYMMKFLKGGMAGMTAERKPLDNFNKFGVNLYLAGACEALCQERNLDGRDRSRVLDESVQVMGFKKSHAQSFAEKYEEYLMADPRYMQMFQAGRNAMNTYLTDEDHAAKHIESAMAEWNKPKPKEQSTGPVTVLFTDIAGSTAMTQTLGDAGAQQILRIHNRIVREALSICSGKEIKHTGDGIMASFGRTSDGLDAAIQMQRETMAHNQAQPELPLHLKIGLNAGEPISEDNDLFGSTVQMSARIVDKAAADQIFVSEIVKGICSGKDFKFINRGGYHVKGFADDPILYEVDWRPAQHEPAGKAAA